MANVNPALVTIGIERCGTELFERYTQTVFGHVVGPKFKPLGGTHDGGADGFVEEDEVLEEVGRPTRFFQASKQITVEAKVRATVARLREVGREVRTLYFASSQEIANIDKVEHDLGEELEVNLHIYDRKYFEQHANDSPAVQAAFEHHLRPAIAFLKDAAAPSYPSNAPIANAQAVCAFLGQELERRIGTVKTLEAVCDSLILWALEGTDPDRGILLKKEEIVAKVLGVIPSVRRFFEGQLNERLKALIRKNEGSRKVNLHAKANGYCLPYETREAIRETTIADEKLKADVTSSFITRLKAHGADKLDAKTFEAIPALLHGTLEGVFERQGSDAARHFLDAERQGEVLNNKAIVELARERLGVSSIKQSERVAVEEMMRHVLRDVFYSSRPVERAYCARLSRTYILLFTLRNTPEVIEYFNGMARNLELSVGSDLIVRALTEHYLPAEDQMTVNAFTIIRQARSTLLLAESTLEEVHSHIHAADREYQSSYAAIDAHVDYALASQCDQILIRAYYYSKLNTDNPKRPRSWAQFLGCFLTYSSMTGPVSPASMKSLRDTLCHRFGLRFLSREDMEKGIPEKDLELLTEKIYEIRKGSKKHDHVRAENDALQILRVHESRKSEDKIGGNPYGYRTWWLTQETKSSAAAMLVFRDRQHLRYVMRPDFLVSYIAYNPTSAEVRTSLQSIFPSIHGVRLAARIDQGTLDKVIGHLRTAHQHDPARAYALITEYGDALKTATVREFVLKYDKNPVMKER